MINLHPGMKVARELDVRKDNMAVGKVLPDGQILWTEIVNSEGIPSNKTTQGYGIGKPTHPRGDERPCPPEYAQYVR